MTAQPAAQPVSQLRVAVGQASDKGRKPLNQDFHAVMLPQEPQLTSKGVAIAIADGISSSEVSQVASQISVKGFLDDYYATSDAWSVKSSVQRVLQANNSWLYSLTRNSQHRYDIEKGYVCTFSTLVLKSSTAHIFHAGDTRVYRVVGEDLEQLTVDHRQWLSRDKSYLSRALGMRDWLEIDYSAHAVDVGETFVLATDGVYEFVAARYIVNAIRQHPADLDSAAQRILKEALEQGSDDNLTVQIVRVDQLPQHSIQELHERAAALPAPSDIGPRASIDGYRILRQLHHSSRSKVYLAEDEIEAKGSQVALKILAPDLRNDEGAVESFLMEEWVARRLDNNHLLKAYRQDRQRNYLYTVMEYLEGQTLAQWMTDNPNPELEAVRDIIEQVGRGLQAMHRQEMLHQDLRPHNIMIDANGTVKIIDFGAVRVAGVAEVASVRERQHILGTMAYTAPEYFVGEPGSSRADLFSLGVIAYQMLSGQLPYGTNVAKASNRTAQRRLVYQSVLDGKRRVPAWVDETLRRAVHWDPNKRYGEISEFVYDLRHPNPAYLRKGRAPLAERDPVLFWKSLSLMLFVTLLVLLATHPIISS